MTEDEILPFLEEKEHPAVSMESDSRLGDSLSSSPHDSRLEGGSLSPRGPLRDTPITKFPSYSLRRCLKGEVLTYGAFRNSNI